MAELSSRRKAAIEWHSKGHILTKFAEATHENEKLRSCRYEVQLSSQSIGYATGTQGPRAKRHKVNLEEKTCTCSFWFQRKIPCRHAIAVAKEAGLITDAAPCKEWIYFSVAPGRHMEQCLCALQQATVELVDIGALERDKKTLPGLAAGQPGRPRKKRIRSNGESVSGGPPKARKCSLCSKCGHTKRACPTKG